ncbi:MAG: zinc-binding dehydrogenase [Rhodothermales bacterium]|nr:zinc-binding dehydrogenase [Rhodothermales bacterium]
MKAATELERQGSRIKGHLEGFRHHPLSYTKHYLVRRFRFEKNRALRMYASGRSALGLPLPIRLREFEMVAAYHVAQDSYALQQYDANVVLIKAKHLDQRLADLGPDYGWGEWINRLQSLTALGDHDTVCSPGNVETVAGLVEPLIERAVEEFGKWDPADLRPAPQGPRVSIPTEATNGTGVNGSHTNGFDGQNGQYGLVIEDPGDFDSIRVSRIAKSTCAPHEVQIQVSHAAFQFKDVLIASGILSNSVVNVGMECAGVVSDIGTDVRHVSIGDRVVAAGSPSFRQYVIRDENLVFAVPEALSLDQAATVPTSFVTAAFSLEHEAKLSEGDDVLIHCASGGVGLAALQIAKDAGARIFATAGSEEKRDYLRKLGVEHIYNSRTTDFAEAIRADNNGRGVDVLLNCLSGAGLEASLEVMEENGRFIELGVSDSYSTDSLPDHARNNRVSHVRIDIDALRNDSPSLFGSTMRGILSRIESGQLEPLPFVTYEFDEALDAFELMSNARHIGKILLRIDPNYSEHAIERR